MIDEVIDLFMLTLTNLQQTLFSQLCRYQVRCLLEQPVFVKQGQVMTGKVLMVANMKQSYDVTIECGIMGTSTKSTNTLDLKNPYFRYTGVQPAPPPGENSTSPSENYWGQVDMQGARQVRFLLMSNIF